MKLYAFSCCCCYGVCDLSGCASFSTRPARLLVLILNTIPIAQSPLPLPLPSSIPVPFPHHIFVIIAWSIWQIQLAIAALAQRSRYSLFLYFSVSVSPSPLPMLLFVVCLSVEFRKISTYKNISSFRFYYESPRLELAPQLSWAELSWAELSWVELSSVGLMNPASLAPSVAPNAIFNYESQCDCTKYTYTERNGWHTM